MGSVVRTCPGSRPIPINTLNTGRCWRNASPLPWFTYKARRGDGTPMWIAVTGKPIFDEKGEFQGYYGAGRDVTEHEEHRPALRRSEERFRALTMLATEWYWETDTELRVTSVRGDPSIRSVSPNGRSIGVSGSSITSIPLLPSTGARCAIGSPGASRSATSS